MKPPDVWVRGDIYTDGSALDGPTGEPMRCGWAFVAVDEQLRVVAAVRGVPPPWLTGIGGVEAWALVLTTRVALPGECMFKPDSKSTVDSIFAGAKKSYARA